MKICYIIILLLIGYKSIAQVDLISNGNFETGAYRGCITDGNDAKNGNSSINGCANWDLAHLNPNDCYNNFPSSGGCNTADWVDPTCYNTNGYYNLRGIPPIGTNGKIIGMWEMDNYTEGIRTILTKNLEAGKYYKIKLRMAVGVQTGGSTAHSRADIKISFSSWGEHWNANPSTTGNVRWNNVAEFSIPAGSPHQWYDFTKAFRAPNSVDGGSANELSNMIIYTKQEANNSSFVYIDDVSLIEYNPCDNPCLEDKYKESIAFRCCGDQEGEVPNAADEYRPWNFKVDNATEFKFSIWDRWGGKLNQFDLSDPNGIKWDYDLDNNINGNFPHFKFVWNGKDNNNNYLPSETVVTYLLEMKNCKQLVSLAGNITVFEGYNGPRYSPIINNTTLDFACCPSILLVDNVVQQYPVGFAANDYLRIATSGPVLIPMSNTTINLTAGKEIEIGPNFQTPDNTAVDIFCERCDHGGLFSKNGLELDSTFIDLTKRPKERQLLSDEISKETSSKIEFSSKLVLIPNPVSQDIVFCKFDYDNENNEETFSYEIYTTPGKQLLFSKAKYSTSKGGIEVKGLDELTPGVYIVRINGNRINLQGKFTIIKN